MKKVIPIFFVFVCFKGFTQQFTATFKDSTKINYEVISDKFQDAHKLNITFPPIAGPTNFGNDYPYLLNASYYSPKIFLANASITINSFSVDGLFFIKTGNSSPIKNSFSVKQSGNVRWKVKHETPRRFHWGIHIGYENGYFNYSPLHPIYLGIGFYRGSGAIVIMPGPHKFRGKSEFAFYADYFKDFSGETFYFKGKKISGDGMRVYLQRKNGFWGSRESGISYGIGIQTLAGVKFSPILILGFYGAWL